jgi:transposase
MSDSPAVPSYEELAALVVAQAAQLGQQAVLIEALRVEIAALRRQVGRDSGNSSQPPG